MRILVDIGGTYARFAFEKNGKLSAINKYAAADFPTFEDALAAYKKHVSAPDKTALRIATAAHPEGKVWRFVNRNSWVLDQTVIAKAGARIEIILNDFEAATWGLIGLKKKKVLKPPRAKITGALCLLGPGTGLGLGFLVPGPKQHIVRKTMGGHVAAAAVTAEQALILQTVHRIKKRPGAVVYEDVVSGFGLYDIYTALCEMDGVPPLPSSAATMMQLGQIPQGQSAIRLFHEFLGLFAATACVAGDAYGGVYLMGGVIERLNKSGLFNAAHFEKFFVADLVPSVRRALDQTPLYLVTDPFIALKGLIKAYA